MLDAILTLSENRKNRKKLGAEDKFDEKAHHLLARKAAAESAVLLKNSEQILPLKPETCVALIGDFAFEPRYQGAGSSVVNTTALDKLVSLIEDSNLQLAGSTRGYLRTGEIDEVMEKEAVDLAASADVVLYCFGLDELSESEGLDRTHMRYSSESDSSAGSNGKSKQKYCGNLKRRISSGNVMAPLSERIATWLSVRTGRRRRNAGYHYRKSKSIWKTERNLSCPLRGHTGISVFSKCRKKS